MKYSLYFRIKLTVDVDIGDVKEDAYEVSNIMNETISNAIAQSNPVFDLMGNPSEINISTQVLGWGGQNAAPPEEPLEG